MKQIWVSMLLFLMTTLLTACGSVTVDSIHPMVQATAVGQQKTFVILPFADHTPTDTPAGYWRRNMLIMESLQDEMLRFGYVPAISEDVISYLSEKKIINQNTIPHKQSNANIVLKAELAKDWSDTMKKEIADVLMANMAKQNNGAPQDFSNKYKSIALDHHAIQDIGHAFNADYVVRGRIIVFQHGREDSFNPLQTGVLPFFFNAGSRTLFGIAQSDNYEMIDKMAIGGLLGAAVARDTWPLDNTSTTLEGGHPRFGGSLITQATSANWNTAIWGLGGASLAHLAHKGGRVDNAIVQLRMIVQDTRNGEILWTNRAEVKTMTQSAFNKKDGDTLMAEAIQQVCGRLFDNFVASDTDRRVVRINDDGTFYVTPAGGLKAQHHPLDPIHIDSPKATVQKRTTFHPISETRKTTPSTKTTP